MMMKRTVLALTIAVAVAALALPATAEEQVAPPRLKLVVCRTVREI